jgi:hypothetical protein
MPLSYEARVMLRKGRKGVVYKKTCGYCGEVLETPYSNKLYHTVCARILNVERSLESKRRKHGEDARGAC